MSEITQLKGVVKEYAWGSHAILANNRGQSSSQNPEAELWFGDYPNGSLPVLTKVLAVSHTLSLQVHPSLDQVSADPNSFIDLNHKPEMLVAISDFYAFVGIAVESEISKAINSICTPTLTKFLLSKFSNGKSISEVLSMLLGTPDEANLIPELIGHLQAISKPTPRQKWSLEVAKKFPDRLDVLATLLCNFVHLSPGEGVYVPPRTIHAYLNGVGVEVMAASDNVVRGGLTSKPIDLKLFLNIADTTPKPAVEYLVVAKLLENGRKWNCADLQLVALQVSQRAQEYSLDSNSIAFVWGGSAEISVAGSQSSTTVGGNLGAIIPIGAIQYGGTGSLWLASQR